MCIKYILERASSRRNRSRHAQDISYCHPPNTKEIEVRVHPQAPSWFWKHELAKHAKHANDRHDNAGRHSGPSGPSRPTDVATIGRKGSPSTLLPLRIQGGCVPMGRCWIFPTRQPTRVLTRITVGERVISTGRTKCPLLCSIPS